MGFSINKNGVMKAGAFQELYVLPDDHSKWLCVFYHDCKGGTVLFKDANEAMYCFKENKYSRLKWLNGLKGADGKYEFLLRYPLDSEGYNRWKQTDNPCSTFETKTDNANMKMPGYEAIHIDWTANRWGGLNLNSSKNDGDCLIDGSVGTSIWYYAIGSWTKYNTGIPGPGSPFDAVDIVELYVRYDTLTSSFRARLDKDGELIASDIIEI